MRYRNLVLLASLLFLRASLAAQGISCCFQATFQGEHLLPNTTLYYPSGDSLVLTTARCYLGNFVFLQEGRPVWTDASHRLLDFSDPKSLCMFFQAPQNLRFDALQFDLGVDSLTNVSGALGGDLDPSKGMYWAWQSGYINCKLEGRHSKCAARDHAFQLHLGGYLPPFQSKQTVRLPLNSTSKTVIEWDLAPFFEQMDWQGKSSIMSPSSAAATMAQRLATCFKQR